MKAVILLITMFLSVQSFAQTTMGPEAVEMFKVASHPSVIECLRDVNVDLVNVEIKKLVARCPGCNTYTITGYKKRIDIASTEKVKITIKGRAVPGTFRDFVQLYTCDISETR